MKGDKRAPKTSPKSSRNKGGGGKPVLAAVADRPDKPRRKWWPWALAGLIVAAVVFEVYGPALRGPFLLDDTYLPFARPGAEDTPLRYWLIGVRPLLMFTYWINLKWSGQDPISYHVVNVVLHIINGWLVFAIALRILAKLDVDLWHRRALAAFGAALFLVHPLQTEAVSYVASRSETLSIFFAYLAFAVFLWRPRDEISWLRSGAILVLLAAASTTKEHTLALPAVLLLTDYFWNPGFSLRGIWRNWRLYIPMVLVAAAGGSFVLTVLRRSSSAGFNVRGVTWLSYFDTQCRAIWVYIGKFILPVNQNVDYTGSFPFSQSISSHGAIFGFLGLLAVSVAAWLYRRRFPLASYGWFVFLIFLAPTSSFVPIQDPLVERRLYLPFVGLVFVVLEFLRRWKAARRVLVAVLSLVIAAEAWAAWQRNQLWGDKIAMWQDAAAKSPDSVRPRFQLAKAYFDLGQFGPAVDEYAKASQIGRPKSDLLVDWGIALAYEGRNDEALQKLQQALGHDHTAYVLSQIAMVDGRAGRYADALAALDEAEKINPLLDLIYYYRGVVYYKQGDTARAAAEFRRGLAIVPSSTTLRDQLNALGQPTGSR